LTAKIEFVVFVWFVVQFFSGFPVSKKVNAFTLDSGIVSLYEAALTGYNKRMILAIDIGTSFFKSALWT
jgi:hypothetical protein